MLILGISAYYHDSAAAIIRDGEIVCAVHEERFTRDKHSSAFPANAVKWCLEQAGITAAELDAVAYYEKPFLRFERLIENYSAFAPRGLGSWIAAMRNWAGEKLFMKNLLKKELRKTTGEQLKHLPILFPEHHLSHMASAFYPSPFEDAAILTIDASGEWATATIAEGNGNAIRIHRELKYPHSLGLLYTAFTAYLGFKPNSGEYKVMGLAPYGNRSSQHYQNCRKALEESLCRLHDDGSLWLNRKWFSYGYTLKMVPQKKWEKLLGVPARKPESDLGQEQADLALALQDFTEEVVLKMAAEAKRITGKKNLCMAGGVALNCVANGKLRSSGMFEEIWVQPAAGDAGGALGAALAATYLHANTARKPSRNIMKNSALGPSWTAEQVQEFLSQNGIPHQTIEEEFVRCSVIADALNRGEVVAWFQGAAEYGPRALGNRSILADARSREMRSKLNLAVKKREGFRPFAPVVPEEHAAQFFANGNASPFMLFTTNVHPHWQYDKPEDFDNLDIVLKSNFHLSALPAVTHADYSARVQTLSREDNPGLYELLMAFMARTGVPVLVNTSFNLRGEPPVLSPEDALHSFASMDAHWLVMENSIIRKSDLSEEQIAQWTRNIDPTD